MGERRAALRVVVNGGGQVRPAEAISRSGCIVTNIDTLFNKHDSV